MNWNIDHIIRELGGTKGIIDLCARHAPNVIPPRPDTITLWKHRKRISAMWLPVVVYAWLEKGFRPEGLFVPGFAPPDEALDLESVGL